VSSLGGVAKHVNIATVPEGGRVDYSPTVDVDLRTYLDILSSRGASPNASASSSYERRRVAHDSVIVTIRP
jgi:hypothetical protein